MFGNLFKWATEQRVDKMPFDVTQALKDHKLESYGSSAIGLLAIALRFEPDDLDLVASKALTEGPNDKKCDVVYIDDLTQTAVICQSYLSNDPKRTEAKANKASDLNTAVGWLLNRDLDDVPSELRPQFREVRDGLRSGTIRFLELWYVHNLPESNNVGDELKTVQATAFACLRTHFPGVECDVTVREIGVTGFEGLWRALQADVAIEGVMEVPINDGYFEEGKDWETAVVSIPASWLHDLFQKYGIDLFKGNVRDYLGLQRSDANINSGIKQTAEGEPEHFFVYNNGVSIITHDARFSGDKKTLKIEGISIVNGAQTTGVLGNLGKRPAESARLQARFIAVRKKEIISSIIRYNNSQNKVEAADFRSSDPIQSRLREEFEKDFRSITYLGARRGGATDRIRRDAAIDSTEVAKALAAFHGLPTLAYNRVKELWNDENYVLIFPQEISAKHIVLVYSLYRAIADYKTSLKAMEENKRTGSQKEQLELLRSGSAVFALMAGIGKGIEQLVGRAVPSKYSLYLKNATTIENGIALWQGPIQVAMPFMKKFSKAVDEGLKNEAAVKAALEEFASSLEAIVASAATSLEKFRSEICD